MRIETRLAQPGDVADNDCSRCRIVRAENSQGTISLVRSYEGYEAALVGYVQRIEAQQFARTAHLIAHFDCTFVDNQVQPGRFGDLHQCARQPAPREVSKAVYVDTCVQQGHYGAAHGGAV